MTFTLVVLSVPDDRRLISLDRLDADEIVILDNRAFGNKGLGFAWNYYFDRARGDVLGVIHADTILSPKACRVLRDTAAGGFVCGIVGMRLDHGVVWSRDVAGDPVRVSTLDACCVVVPRACGLRCDTDVFDSFHLVAEDLCLQAQDAGIPVVVPATEFVEHEGQMTLMQREQWQAEHSFYHKRLTEKWKHVRFATT